MRGKRLRVITACLLICLLSVACTASSAARPDSTEGFVLYYLNHDRTAFAAEPYEPEADTEDTEALVDELLLMLQTPPSGQTLLAPVTEDVTLREYRLDGDLLTLDFDVRYLELDRATEVLTRAAVVCTLCRIEGVEGVLFLVSGVALMKDNDTPVGVMNEELFLFDVRNDEAPLRE